MKDLFLSFLVVQFADSFAVLHVSCLLSDSTAKQCFQWCSIKDYLSLGWQSQSFKKKAILKSQILERLSIEKRQGKMKRKKKHPLELFLVLHSYLFDNFNPIWIFIWYFFFVIPFYFDSCYFISRIWIMQLWVEAVKYSNRLDEWDQISYWKVGNVWPQ